MFDINSLSPSPRRQILASGIPMKNIGMEMSDLEDTQAKKMVEAWIQKVLAGEIIQNAGSPKCGVGLMLVGKPGHGKTTMASTALQSLIRGITEAALDVREPVPTRVGAFMDYPKLLRIQKAQWDNPDEDTRIMLDSIYGDSSKINNVRVFVLDDLGKEYKTASGYAENNFDALLRSRFNAGLPTIVTTNIPAKDWGGIYGEAMGSFAKEAFLQIPVIAPGGDRR